MVYLRQFFVPLTFYKIFFRVNCNNPCPLASGKSLVFSRGYFGLDGVFGFDTLEFDKGLVCSRAHFPGLFALQTDKKMGFSEVIFLLFVFWDKGSAGLRRRQIRISFN